MFRGAKKRTFRFGKKNVSFPKVETFRFADYTLNSADNIKGCFYFRTAHRNEPDFTTQTLSKQNDPKNNFKFNTLMTTDASVSENYQRLVSHTLSGVFSAANEDKTVKSLKQELIGKIAESLSRVFDDLQLSSIGEPFCLLYTSDAADEL